MKKLIVTCVMIFTLSGLYAQRVGIKAGFNLAHANYDVEGLGITTTNLPRYQVGLVGEIPLTKTLYLNSGIMYTVKGVELSFMGEEIEFPVSYLEVPLNLQYKFDLGLARVFAMAGPYAAYGVSAKSKRGDNVENIEFGTSTNEMARIDYGVNFGTGIEFERFSFGVNYGLGLPNLSNLEEETMKNGVLSLTIAFMVGR